MYIFVPSHINYVSLPDVKFCLLHILLHFYISIVSFQSLCDWTWFFMGGAYLSKFSIIIFLMDENKNIICSIISIVCCYATIDIPAFAHGIFTLSFCQIFFNEEEAFLLHFNVLYKFSMCVCVKIYWNKNKHQNNKLTGDWFFPICMFMQRQENHFSMITVW